MSESHEDLSAVHNASMEETEPHVSTAGLGMLSVVLKNKGVKRAVATALAAGVPWWQIIAAILPLIMQVFVSGKIDFAAIIAAIMELINRPVVAGAAKP